MSTTPGAILVADPIPLELEFGGGVPGLEISYETWGELDEARDNAILVCPAFSAHSHANSGPADPSPGWWEGMIGPGKAFDTDRFFVLCPSLLGGSYGTTGPKSINPETGKAYRGDFPVISVRDICAVHIRLLDLLGIDRLYAAGGGSLGGMEALELAIRYPSRVARVISASGTSRTRPFTAAIRHLGRRAIMADPAFKDGFYDDEIPARGLMVAREIGTLFYRSREEFDQRFRWQPINPPNLDGITFDVQSYLDHQARKVVGRFDPNSYLRLSLAMDLHDVWRGFPSREAALEPVTASFLVIGVEQDRLIPIDEQEWVHYTLAAAGKRSLWRPLSSRIGHDAFLVEIDKMTALIKEFFAS